MLPLLANLRAATRLAKPWADVRQPRSKNNIAAKAEEQARSTPDKGERQLASRTTVNDRVWESGKLLNSRSRGVFKSGFDRSD